MYYLRPLALALALALAFSSTAGAAVYYVDQACPLAADTNAGTDPLHPWKTIGKAYNVIRAGDTVDVFAGTYAERVTFRVSGTAAQPITYQAIPQGSVQMCGFDTSNCSHLVINGFIFTPLGSISGQSNTANVNVNSSYVQILNNQFLNLPDNSIWSNSWHTDSYTNVTNILVSCNRSAYCEYGFIVGGSNWIVERNEVYRLHWYGVSSDCDYTRCFGVNDVIRDNFFHGCVISEIGSAHVDGCQTFTENNDYANNDSLTGNVILDCGEGFMGSNANLLTTSGSWTFTNNIVSISLGSTYQPAWGFDCYQLSNMGISHNTVVNAYYYGAGIRYATSGAITDNIFTNLPQSCVLDDSTGVTNDYNLSWDTQWVSPQGPHDLIGVDPKYVNLAAENFRLTAGSPAIGAAPDGTTLGALEYPNVYHVDQHHPGASANWFGYFGAPYQTITQAAAVAQPGETISIRGGTYRETVTLAQSNVLLMSYSGEPVIISGADAITAWTRTGSGWQAPLPAAPTQILCNGAAFSAYTYDAVNHLILLPATSDPRLSLYETVVRQNALNLQGHSGVVFTGLQLVNTLGPAVINAPPTPTASLDCTWAYQNTSLCTANRHMCALTIQPGTADPCTVGVVKLSGSGNVTIQSTSNALVWNILGGPASGGLACTGSCLLETTVTDLTTGYVGKVDTPVTVRLLGAVTNTGTVTTADRDALDNRLNGLPTPGLTDRDLDLTGDGDVTAADRVLLNLILNRLAVP